MGLGGVVIAAVSVAVQGIEWVRERRRDERERGDDGTSTTAVDEVGDARYPGASRRLRGNPTNTIIAVKGVDGISRATREALLAAAEELQIPVDSMAAVISSESQGFNPRALNPLPAAGLIQLTLGAKLPGFDTKEKIRAITEMAPEQQIKDIVIPYYKRLGAKVQGASPGEFYMANFLPSKLGMPESTILGDGDADPSTFLRKVYDMNPGFHRNGKITIGDVYDAAGRIVTSARGRRIQLDGKVLESGTKAATEPPPATGGGSVVSSGGELAGALLRAVNAGSVRAPEWFPVPVGDDAVFVTTDAVAAPFGGKMRRLPVSWDETIEIARKLGAVPVSRAISDASWLASAVKIAPQPLVSTSNDAAKMAGVEFMGRHNDYLDAHVVPGSLCRDMGKDWIVDESGKPTNYGWRDLSGTPIQSVGHRHDAAHRDYSQVLVLAKRTTAFGKDLLEIYRQQGVPNSLLARLR